MTISKSSGDNGFESSDGWEVEDEVEIPNGNGEADNNNMEANFEAICDTARYVHIIKGRSILFNHFIDLRTTVNF